MTENIVVRNTCVRGVAAVKWWWCKKDEASVEDIDPPACI